MAYVVNRLLWGIFTVVAISVAAFLIMFVLPPDDPAARIAGKNPTPEVIEAIRSEWGFDKPVPVQYVNFMKRLVQGDLVSQSSGQAVLPLIRDALPVTASLAAVAALIWLTVGVGLGIVGARQPGSRLDRSIMVTAIIGISLPVAWLALLALWWLTDLVPIFPAGGYVTIGDGGLFLWGYHLLLPALTLCVVLAGVYARMTRTNVLQAERDEHVKTAWAKGIPEQQVWGNHILRTGLIPIVVLFGMDMGQLMAGALFTESIFGLPGLGKLIFDAIGTLDQTLLIVAVMLAAIFVVLANLIVDLVQAAIDPRVRA